MRSAGRDCCVNPLEDAQGGDDPHGLGRRHPRRPLRPLVPAVRLRCSNARRRCMPSLSPVGVPCALDWGAAVAATDCSTPLAPTGRSVPA